MTLLKAKKQPACIVRLDRLAFTANGRSDVPKKIPGFAITQDFRPRPQGKLETYGRVRIFKSTSNSARVCVQYKPLLPWLPPTRFVLIADDEDGISASEVESALAQCLSHKLSMAELAFDFVGGSVVDRQSVLRHAKFGKSHLRVDLGGGGNLRYGSRGSPKLVRAYFKATLGRFRVELEIHSALLRTFGISTGYELGLLAAKVVPKHFEFLAFRWKILRSYLLKKFGQRKGETIFLEARARAESSLHNANRFLACSGVPNPHRFIGELRINLKVQAAIMRWAREFPVDGDMFLNTK